METTAIRDTFAAHAMKSIMDAHQGKQVSGRSLSPTDTRSAGPLTETSIALEEIAKAAYAMADAMMAARGNQV